LEILLRLRRKIGPALQRIRLDRRRDVRVDVAEALADADQRHARREPCVWRSV
jgi:hypothetical protein